MFTFFRKPFRQCYIHQGIQTGLQETLGVREDTTKNKKNVEHIHCTVCTLSQILIAVIRS